MRMAYRRVLVMVSFAAALGLMVPLHAGRSREAAMLHKRLSTGLQLIAVQSPGAELAAVDVWIRAGSAMESVEERGAAHFLEHMLFKGTPTRPAGAIDFAVETCGGILNAGTTRDGAHIFATVDPAYVSPVLSVIADAVRNPLLDSSEFELERAVILDEFARDLDRSSRLLQDAACGAAYSNHPYARPVLGTAEDIRHISRDTVRAFHDRYYRPQRAVVVVVSPAHPTSTLEAMEKTFSDWQAQTPLDATVARSEQIRDGWRPASFGPVPAPAAPGEPARTMMIWKTPPATSSEDIAASELIAALVEPVAASSSSIAGSAGAEAIHGMEGGLIVAWYPASAPGTAGKLRALVQRLSDVGPTPAELAAATRRVLGRHLYAMETVAGMAREVGKWALYGYPNLPLEYGQLLERATLASVREYARKWLTSAGTPPQQDRTP